MSSAAGVSPTPGQYSCASRPWRAASCRFSAAVPNWDAVRWIEAGVDAQLYVGIAQVRPREVESWKDVGLVC